MTDFDWTLVPANMDYYRRSEVDNLIERAQTELQTLQDSLVLAEKLIIKLALQKGGQVDEMRDLKARLTKADALLTKHYPCYSETNCKKCVGDWDKIHYETCAGYNVLRALRGEVD